MRRDDPLAPAAARVPLRLGTRGSALALAQTGRVVARLGDRGRRAEPVVIRPEGDVDKSSPLTLIGGRGVFTSALSDAVLAGGVDAAVHSAKDLPSEGTAGLTLAAFPEREDPRDVLVSRHGLPLAELPPRPTIGTSSRRRATQVLQVRPDARIADLRGNLDTRLRKALDPAAGSGLDAVVLAAAGIERMGWQAWITELLPLDRFVPAPGQGALAVETRTGDAATTAAVAAIDDPAVARAVRAERAFLRAIGAGCTTPVGAHVAAEGGRLRLRAMLAAEDGPRVEWADEWLDPDLAAAEARVAEIARRLLRLVGAARVAVRAPSPGTGATNGRRRAPTTPAEDRPLAGQRVLVTRAREQAAPLVAALRERGAEPLLWPTIRIAPAADAGPLDAALRRLGDEPGAYDWLVFTSANAVDQTLDRLSRLGLEPAVFSHAAVAAVGAATAGALARVGVAVALVPERADAEGLLAALAASPRGVAGRRVLFPRGDLARGTLAAGLRARGADVDDPIAYRTLPVAAEEVEPAVRERVARGEIDAATFASPSSLRHLARALGGTLAPLAGARVVCVGGTTAAAARELGIAVDAVAEDALVAGLVAAVAAAVDADGERRSTTAVAGAAGAAAGERDVG